jgi:hypothetical protein
MLRLLGLSGQGNKVIKLLGVFEARVAFLLLIEMFVRLDLKLVTKKQ